MCVCVLYIVYSLRGSILFQMLFVFLTVLLTGSQHFELWYGGFSVFFFKGHLLCYLQNLEFGP